MSVQTSQSPLPYLVGILVIIVINVFVGILAGRFDFQVTGDLQILVWAVSFLAGAISVIQLQE